MYYLYALLKKNKVGSFIDRVFYIGQTTDIKTRMYNHRYPVANNRIKSSIVKKYGFEYLILESFENKNNCDDKEEFLIRFIGKISESNGPLANLSDGTAGDKTRYKELDIISIIDNFLKSGLSLRNYCIQYKVARKTLSRWCKSKNVTLKRGRTISVK